MRLKLLSTDFFFIYATTCAKTCFFKDGDKIRGKNNFIYLWLLLCFPLVGFLKYFFVLKMSGCDSSLRFATLSSLCLCVCAHTSVIVHMFPVFEYKHSLETVRHLLFATFTGMKTQTLSETSKTLETNSENSHQLTHTPSI